MSLSAPFISRPIGTSLLACGIVLSGVLGFYSLPVAALPEVEFPTINVQATLPGASPAIMASSVATPLERQLGHIAGITEMTSSNILGSTSIVIQFDLSRSIDGAARDVQAAINAARSQLPSDLPSQPSYRKVNPADTPILILALTSPIYSTGAMYDIASTILAQKLAQISGVGQVIVGGSSLPAVRIEIDPTRLVHYGLSLEQVRTQLMASSVMQPVGQISDRWKTSEIVINDQLSKPEEYQNIIIAYQNGAPIVLSDIATVIQGIEDVHTIGLANGEPAVFLIVFKQPNSNVIEAVRHIKKEFPALQAILPEDIHMKIMLDRTITVKASLSDIETTLFIAVLLVTGVIYLFLGNARSALIPALTIPLSLLGTCFVMYLCGFSLNNLSLMALTIATGFVVDDAVIVLENISRHIEAKMSPVQAALQGAKEVGYTIVCMTISLIVVFMPIIFMGGIIGRLFNEFAMTLTIAILISMVISLTVTPMLCAYLLRPEDYQEKPLKKQPIFLYYQKTLNWALDRPNLMLLLTLMTCALTVTLFIIIPKGGFPTQDTGRIMGAINAQQNISFQGMTDLLHHYVKVVGDDPAVDTVAAIVGGGNSRTTNTGSIYIALKPLNVRKVSVDTIIRRLRNQLSVVPGADLYLSPSQDLVIGGRQGNAQFLYALTSFDLDTLHHWEPKVLDAMRKIPGIVDLNSDQLEHGLQLFVTVDRERASSLNLSAQTIDNTLYDAYGQRQVLVTYTPMNQYHVVMELDSLYTQTPQMLKDLYIPSTLGDQVPLSVVAKNSVSETLLSVGHQGQFPAATLSFNLLPGVALGDVMDPVNQVLANLPIREGTLSGSFQGSAQAFADSMKSEKYLVMGALIAVYIILGVLYESLIHPLTILSTLPSAGVGALLALIITGTELSIIAIIGLILLIGIVKKNAIMMIDVALYLERNEGKSSRDAIYEACLLRFRPIMMTTMAALLSAIPLAYGQGMGSELRRPLGIAIIGGLIFSQVLTLYTTPIIYLSFERLIGARRKQS